MKTESRVANRTILRKLVVVSVLMFGFGWALVPLYRKICEITGINVLTTRNADAERQARNTQVDTSRNVIVEFDANKQGAWSFKPHKNYVEVNPGALVQVQYDLVNLENRRMAGQAIPSYAPMQAGATCKSSSVFVFGSRLWQPARRGSFLCCFLSIRSCPAI